jgi:DNA-binding transcriptional LysR family regulator
VQEAAALVASVRELGREPAGVLRVQFPPGMPPHLVTPLFAALRSAYGKLSVRIRLRDDPMKGLLDDVDIAVHFGDSTPPGPWTSFEIVRVREWLIAHRDYLAARGTPTSVAELAGHELFAFEGPGEDGKVWPLLQGGSVTVTPSLVATDVHLLRQCVIAGLGIGLVPDALVDDPGVAPGDIVPVLQDVIGRDRGVRVVVPSALAELPKIRAVLQHARGFLDGV